MKLRWGLSPVGAAWFDPLAFLPARPWVAAEDVLVACCFTGLGVLWLVVTGQIVGPRGAGMVHHARAHAEAAFATNALCFFVGWAYATHSPYAATATAGPAG